MCRRAAHRERPARFVCKKLQRKNECFFWRSGKSWRLRGGRRQGAKRPERARPGPKAPGALFCLAAGGALRAPPACQTPPPPPRGQAIPRQSRRPPPMFAQKAAVHPRDSGRENRGGDPAFYPAWPWGDDRYQIRNAGATRCIQVPARGIVAKYSPTCCPAGYPRGNRCRR